MVRLTTAKQVEAQGSLKLLADSWTPDELNRLGMHMYVSMIAILDTIGA